MVRLSYKSVKYILFLLITLLAVTNSAFALEQIHEITGTGWNTQRITTNVNGNLGTGNYTVNNTTCYRIYGSTNNSYSEGFRWHSLNIPGNVNARFSWIYSPYATTSRTFEMSFRYGTRNNSTNGDVSVLTYNSTTANTNRLSGEETVRINAGNYYAKAYYYGYRNAYAYYYSLSCNTSPANLTTALTTTTRNINGNFTFINGVSCNWNTSTSNVTALSNYKLYRSSTSGSGYQEIDTIPAGTTTYLDIPETAGTYYYTITDVGSDGTESPKSLEASITSPGKVTGLTGEVATPDTPSYSYIKLHCNPAPGNIYFFRGTTSGNYTRNQSWGGNTTINDETGLEDDTLYYYSAAYVYSYSPLTYSPLCEEISVYYLKPPQNFNAHYSYDFNNFQDKIVLNWDAKTLRISNLQSYSIYRSNSTDGTYNLIGSVDASTTTFSDTNVISGNTYYYKITCNTNLGSSGLSFPVSAYVSKPPTNLTANMVNSNRVDLSWTAPSPANTQHGGFYIYRGLTKEGPFTQIGQVWDTNTYSDTDNPYGNRLNIDDGDCIYYAVADFNYTNEVISGYSNIAKATKLFPPTNLTAADSNGSVVLTWNASSCPLAKLGGYYIYRSETQGSNYKKIATIEGNILTYTDNYASEEVPYYYVVSTYNINGGESDYSNEANITLPKTINLTLSFDNSIVPQLVLTESDIADIKLNWVFNSILPSATVTGYKISIIDENGNSIRNVTISANQSTTTYTVSNVPLRNNGTYRGSIEVIYTINGSNRNSLFFSSNQFTAITPATIAVRDGWSGKDIAYSYFENRVEANWEHDSSASIVRYEAAVGTTPYGNELVDWHNIGLPNRIAINTPTLASGTIYYTSIRGINQVGNQVVKGCSDGFTARRDPVDTDTSAFEYFNNARVMENLSTENGRLTPTGTIGGSSWHYCKPIIITEPGIVDRINAPCLISFTPNPAPNNVREFRVYDDRGNECPRYNLSNTANAPQIVFLVNIRKGETKTYYVYWGNTAATDPDYGFVMHTDDTSLTAWTPYYSRINLPAGLEDETGFTKYTSYSGGNLQDDGYFTKTLNKFKYFNTNYNNGTFYVGTNGYGNFTPSSTTYRNVFSTFTGSWRTISILWCDLYFGTSDMVNAGVYDKYVDTPPRRRIFMWKSHRYAAHDDRYILQAVLYETGDIKFIYNFIGYRALYEGSGYDNPIVTPYGSKTAEHTAGISFGNNNYYLTNWKDLVSDAYDVTPSVFYQCLNAFEDTTDYSQPIIDNYKVAYFESMVFDTKLSAPIWNSISYKANLGANCFIDFYYRTGSTPLPEQGGWSNWSNATALQSTNDGIIDLSSSNQHGRYIQYKAVFRRTSGNAVMYIDEVKFIYGGISVEKVSSVNASGEPITEVTQGEQNIPVEVTITNNSNQAQSLNTCNLKFSLGGHTATIVDNSVLSTIPPGESITATFSVNIADDAPTGICIIDAYASASPTIYDEDSQIVHQWTVKSKAALVIDNVYSEYTKVTKGYSYNLFITLTNTGETDCMLNSIWPTYASGTYNFTFDSSYGLATGTYPGGGENCIIHGNETKTAKFIVEILPESTSGSDTLGAVASATNLLSGERIEVLTTENPHIWTIQTPAELNLYDIIASSTLYRGQKNNNIILLATNEGEAELEWYPGSSTEHINFTPITGLAKSYENKKMITEEPVINITSDNIVKAQYSIDIKQDTATGTDRITTQLFGKEINTGVSLDYLDSFPYAEWTIYAEKVNTYADGAYMEEKDSFNLPSGIATLTVYAKVENLAANVEYIVHWIAPDETEVETTTPIITSGQGYFGCWHDFNSSSQSGLYKIRVTDSLNLYVCCENTFEVVAPAEMDASFTLPLYATVNQPIVASFTFINLGGAVIANATLVPTDTVDISRPGAVVFTPDDTEALFSPRLSDVPGYGQATTTFKLRAATVGTVQLTTSATGFDNNSGMTLSKPNVQSNICTIQNPPNVQITAFVASTSATAITDRVYLNQKNIRVTAYLKNTGEATAVLNAASITFNIGTYEQELLGFPEDFEIELPSNATTTLSFDVSVDASSATGYDTLTLNVKWYDKNWPINQIVSRSTNWTIVPCGIKLSSDPSFSFEQADFCSGQTVYIKVFGLEPNSISRVRYYNSQIAKTNSGTTPTGNLPIGYGGVSGPLRADENGEFGFNYILTYPSPITIGTWTVTVETSESNYSTYGSMLALQYFRVQYEPHMTAVINAENVSIENGDKIFEGDTFRVTMTLTSTRADNNTNPATYSGAIDFIEPYSLVRNNGAQGNVELVSGPEPATFTLRAGESKTFEYVYRAILNTGSEKFSFKSSDTYAAKGRNRNRWDHNDSSEYDVFAIQQLTSNQIDIYTKSMRVDPSTLAFGHSNILSEDYPRVGLICGESQELNMNLIQEGNYAIENIRLNSASLNGPIDIVNGTRRSISSTYLNIDVASFSNPFNKPTNQFETTKASITIPYNQPEGDYLSTMFLYSDANNNGVFDTGEVTADFNLQVYVNSCKVIKINDKVVDAGGWSRGTTTSNFEVNYFNAGNLDLNAVKITGVGSLTQYISFSTPTDVGSIPIGEYEKAVFCVEIPSNAGLGGYIATYTIFEDKNGNDICDSTEPYDKFEVHMTIGQMAFEITPTAITASPVETSFTAQTGIYPPGFSQLRINNNSSNGMPLTRIKMIADNFDGVDKNNNHYVMASNTVAIYPGSLKQPLDSGESDIFDIEVYIAPGTRCATYTTTLHFFSDDNDNNQIDTGETKVDVLLKVYVKPTQKVKIIDKPVSVTGMSSQIQETIAECEFLCYNLGNVDLKYLNFEMQNLVQRDYIGSPVTIDKSAATFSFVGNNPFVAPLNSEFSSKVTIHVPQGTPEGVYITTAFCRIYNDNGGDPDYNGNDPNNPEAENNYPNASECFDEFQIWLQIGEMKLVILNSHNVQGDPSERSSEGPFTVKNDGALTVTSVNATATSFIYNGNVIPATASTFLSSPKVGTLKPGFQKTLNWVVDIPDCMPAGVYTGKVTVWSDTDGNSEIGAAEASASANVSITVNPCQKLSIRSDGIDPVDMDHWSVFIMKNSTVQSPIRLYNTGNQPITSPIQVAKSNLTFMTNVMSKDDYSIATQPILPIMPGEYVIATLSMTLGDTNLVNGSYIGELNFYVGDIESPICSDHITLEIELGEKILLLNPNPLIFDNLPSINTNTIRATNGSRASLNHIYVYEKSHCNRNETYCDETKIECITEIPTGGAKIPTEKDFTFKITVGPQTPPGEHIATWTFFDDGDGDGLYDEGEFFVDFQIIYYVPETPKLSIIDDYPIIDVAPGETVERIYRIVNTGNTPIDLSNTGWTFVNTTVTNENGTQFILGDPTYGFKGQPIPLTGELAVDASTTYTITLSANDEQELGVYPVNQSHTIYYNGLPMDSTLVEKIMVVRRGPVTPTDTVYQVVASDSFIDCTIATQSYIVSAWICPGLNDNFNRSAANLSVIRCDKDGKPKAALSIRMFNNEFKLENNLETADYKVYKDNPDYENVGPSPATFSFCIGTDGKPICGISGDPLIAIDNSNESLPDAEKPRLTFYRVYFAFNVGESIATDSYGMSIEPENQDKIAILLTQSIDSHNTASTTVYFDGIKLEKSLLEGQDRPTTYHKSTTLVSPSNLLDVSGKHKHYEW